MAKYTHLIPQNIADSSAKKIVVFSPTGKQVGTISLGRLTMPASGEKLYSFGALSDVHITKDTATEDFQKALIYLNEDADVAFTCICGDLTENGSEEQLAQYKAIVDANSADTPVYAISGNHESFVGAVTDERLVPYTGQPLYYSFSRGNDVFIMCGYHQLGNETMFADGELQWVYETLEANRNKRCFVFFHVFPWGDSGNPGELYWEDMFVGTQGSVFQSLLKHYKNTLFFHGHSHTKFELQEIDEKANYSEALGYRSIHIPSLSVPRDIIGDSLNYIYADSEGYVVDVYENGVHLRGRDFIKGEFLPIASYWLDTTLKTIESGTYWDDTGTVDVPGDLTYARSEDGSHYICVGVKDGVSATTITVAGTLNGLPVTEVGSGAFSTLTGLTKIIFQTTPTSIADDAFSGTNVATIVMPSAPDILDGSPWGSGYLRPRFEIGGVIYRRHNTTSRNQYILDGTTSAFPGGVIEFVDYIGGTPVYELDASSFKNKTTITELVIPATVKSIEASVFSGCTGLTEVTFKGTPSSIPATVFDGCTNLLNIYVPWAEGEMANAPWGATNATIHYNAT